MNILLIANCRLGDALVMIPALKLLRRQFPDSHITLTSETTPAGIVSAQDILGGRGLIDEFIPMAMPDSKLARLWARLKWLMLLRKLGPWKIGIVLMPPYPPLTMALVSRFKLYLRISGAQRIIAPDTICHASRLADGSLERLPHVSDAMVGLLEPLGISSPAPGKADASLPSSSTPAPCRSLPSGHLWAIAPGTNMPSKCWAHYGELLEALQRRLGIVPVYIGGENDKPLCEELNRKVPGICIIGRTMPEVEAIIRQCEVYLGNDTGIMHLAAALGLRCIAIFSCRDIPGIWEPYTNDKLIFRATNMNCEGCLLTICPKRHNACMEAITVSHVMDRILSE
ncbi:MAG: glycosyltransferase family 9 protein [Victivallales bacterium]|nr:glycosyltransferase family 9 protein [Victivallales bacterium]